MIMPSTAFSGFDEITLPNSIEAEQAVLGCVLTNPDALSRAVNLLRPEYFYLPQHREIFSMMLELDSRGQTVDPLVLLERMKSAGTYDEASGKNYLFQLAEAVPSTRNVESYCGIIREKYFVRSLIETSKSIIDEAVGSDESADMLVDSAEQKIYDIRKGKASVGPSKISDIITNEVYEKLHRLSGEDRDLYRGAATGFKDLDRMTTGLNRSDLIIVGARPAMGKTSFALNMATNIALREKKKVLFFSLEMTKEQLAERVLSTEARVLSTKMRSGEINDNEWTRIAQATNLLYNCELYFDDTSSITVPEMRARIRRLKDVDVVFIDYLQLMKGTVRSESRVQEVSEITRNLKLMAKDMNIPVVVLAQLSRSTESRNARSHRPQLSDLRESGSIEQDADIVLMLYRDEYYAPAGGEEDSQQNSNVNKVEIIIAKNRHGPTQTVECMWNGDYTLFSNMDSFRDE